MINPMIYFVRPSNIVLFPTSAVKNAVKTGPQEWTAFDYMDGVRGLTNVDWNGLENARIARIKRNYGIYS